MLELVPENMYKIARNHAKAKVSNKIDFTSSKKFTLVRYFDGQNFFDVLDKIKTYY